MSHMKISLARSAVLSLVAASLSVALVPAVASAGSADPVANGCPPSFELLSLTFLASQGPYQQPFATDAAGNNNGYVCGKPVNPAAYRAQCGPTCPVPVLYNFLDDKI